MVPRFATLGRIPKGVWVLGGVSLLMDVSSEMIHSLLPLFMATTLGASVIIIGLIEGLAEATALILKVFRRDQRLRRQAQRAGAAGLRPGRAQQAAVCHRPDRRRGV